MQFGGCDQSHVVRLSCSFGFNWRCSNVWKVRATASGTTHPHIRADHAGDRKVFAGARVVEDMRRMTLDFGKAS